MSSILHDAYSQEDDKEGDVHARDIVNSLNNILQNMEYNMYTVGNVHLSHYVFKLILLII